MQQLQQEDWIRQQIEEKKQRADLESFTNRVHDEQTLHFNQLLTDAQNQHAAQRTAMEKSVKEANAQAAKEKRDRDAAQRAYEQYQATHDVNFTNAHDFMTENP